MTELNTTNTPEALSYAFTLSNNMLPFMRAHLDEFAAIDGASSGDRMQAYTDMRPLGGAAVDLGIRTFVKELGLAETPEDRVMSDDWNVFDAATDYLISRVASHFNYALVDADQDSLMRAVWESVVTETIPMDEIDEGGLPVHLRMGVTVDGFGPVGEQEADFDHVVCWCANPMCIMSATIHLDDTETS